MSQEEQEPNPTPPNIHDQEDCSYLLWQVIFFFSFSFFLPEEWKSTTIKLCDESGFKPSTFTNNSLVVEKDRNILPRENLTKKKRKDYRHFFGEHYKKGRLPQRSGAMVRVKVFPGDPSVSVGDWFYLGVAFMVCREHDVFDKNKALLLVGIPKIKKGQYTSQKPAYFRIISILKTEEKDGVCVIKGSINQDTKEFWDEIKHFPPGRASKRRERQVIRQSPLEQMTMIPESSGTFSDVKSAISVTRVAGEGTNDSELCEPQEKIARLGDNQDPPCHFPGPTSFFVPSWPDIPSPVPPHYSTPQSFSGGIGEYLYSPSPPPWSLQSNFGGGEQFGQTNVFSNGSDDYD